MPQKKKGLCPLCQGGMRKGKKNPAARAGQNQVNFDKENLVQEVKNMKDSGKVR